MVDVEKEMMKEIMADYHSGDPRKVASAKEQILNKAQRRDCEKKSVNKILL